MLNINQFQPTRRDFLQIAGASAGAALASSRLSATEPEGAHAINLPKGKVDHCVMIWLGGGACHIDTWDPKMKGDARAKKPGSYYDPIDTAIEGEQIC